MKVIQGMSVIGISVFLTTITISATDGIRGIVPASLTGMVIGGESVKCPKDMTFVNSSTKTFCIDTYEASANESCFYIDPVNQEETRVNLSFPDCNPVSGKGKKPWRNISQNQAEAACAKAGKRLPTNHEWYTAALGTSDLNESWSSHDCNVAGNWAGAAPGETGTAERCVSGAGAYDMIGNVWEWVSGTMRAGVYQGITLPSEGYVTAVDENGIAVTTAANPDLNYYKDRLWVGEDIAVAGMFRGGYWNSRSDAGVYALYGRGEPSFTGDAIGFRCVK